MTEQIYLDRIEKGVKIIRTYDIMINQQQNYKTLPHYMKVFGDFCLDYLKYKTVGNVSTAHNIESISELLDICKESSIDVAVAVLDNSDLIQKCKDCHYTDVSECMKIMPVTTAIITEIVNDLGIQ